MSIGNVNRSLPGRRPPVLFLDPTVGVDVFEFGSWLCDGRHIEAKDVQMRLYVAGCEPAVFIRRNGCTCASQMSGFCEFCEAWEWPAELDYPNDRGGWPPNPARRSINKPKRGVVLPALELLPAGRVSFQYDSVTNEFVSQHYTRQLIGIFFANCHPCGHVIFLTDPKVRPIHIDREINSIPVPCDSDCLTSEPKCPSFGHPVREQCCPEKAESTVCDPVTDRPYYDYSERWR